MNVVLERLTGTKRNGPVYRSVLTLLSLALVSGACGSRVGRSDQAEGAGPGAPVVQTRAPNMTGGEVGATPAPSAGSVASRPAGSTPAPSGGDSGSSATGGS